MKILFISDIHGITKNLSKLDKIIKEEKIKKLVVLGDLYYQGFNQVSDNLDNFTVRDFLTKYKDILICMRGNCDSLVDIEKSPFPIIEDISIINIDNLDIYITHGNRYNCYNNDTFTNGVMVYGHEHIPYIKQELDMTYINVGSISLPRDGNPPTFMIYENKKFTIYDIDKNVINSITV